MSTWQHGKKQEEAVKLEARWPLHSQVPPVAKRTTDGTESESLLTWKIETSFRWHCSPENVLLSASADGQVDC